MLVGPRKCLKQTFQIELNRVKNPDWPEANQLAIYKRGQGFELVTTVNKSSKRSGRDLNLGPLRNPVLQQERWKLQHLVVFSS